MLNFKTCLFVVLALLSSFSLLAQTEVYIDENMKEISKDIYIKKCEAYAYKCYNYRTDSLKVNKIFNKHRFGKLSPQEFNQVKMVIEQSSKTSIDANKTIAVRFGDSLRGYKSYVKHTNLINSKIKARHEEVKVDHKNAKYKTVKIINEAKFDKNHQKYIKNQLKCVKKLDDRYNTVLNYFFRENSGHKNPSLNLGWTKDRGVLGNLFFPYGVRSGFLILKPNGEYFVSYQRLANNQIFKLLENDWSEYKTELELTKAKNSKKGLDFFAATHNHGNKKNCY